ncbi:MAG: pilus assembly protein TadG-related protein, partial [Gemmatimonadota bacterium]
MSHRRTRFGDDRRAGALRRAVRDEQGATLVMVALGSLVLLSTLAIAVDMGMLLTARGESQRTADGAALAGAGS